MANETIELPKLLTTAEAAKALRVSARTIRRLRKDGKLKAAKPGGKLLIKLEDVRALIEG